MLLCFTVCLLLISASLLRGLNVSWKPVWGKSGFELPVQWEQAGQAGSQTLFPSFRSVPNDLGIQAWMLTRFHWLEKINSWEFISWVLRQQIGLCPTRDMPVSVTALRVFWGSLHSCSTPCCLMHSRWDLVRILDFSKNTTLLFPLVDKDRHVSSLHLFCIIRYICESFCDCFANLKRMYVQIYTFEDWESVFSMSWEAALQTFAGSTERLTPEQSFRN